MKDFIAEFLLKVRSKNKLIGESIDITNSFE